MTVLQGGAFRQMRHLDLLAYAYLVHPATTARIAQLSRDQLIGYLERTA